VFLSGSTHDENIDLINEILQEEFKHEVLDISEKIIYSLANQYTSLEEHKHLIYYLYDDDKGVDINFKALSVDPWMQDDFAFVSLYNPSQQLRQGQPSLPTVAGFLRMEEENEPAKMFSLNDMLKVTFLELRRTLLGLTDKQEEFD